MPFKKNVVGIDFIVFLRYILLGVNIMERDYDDRTVLHVAASEGNENILKFLLKKWNEVTGQFRFNA